MNRITASDTVEYSFDPVNTSPNVSSSDHFVTSLNQPQQDAVLAVNGPVLVLAGAGTGKTRVLTSRLAYLIEQGYAQPYQVLAVTFTNKASGEMRERTAALLSRKVDGMWLGTFHSLSVRILRTHGKAVGLETNFTILDMDDQLRLIKQILKAENIDEKFLPPKTVLNQISRWKDQALFPHQVVPEPKTQISLKIYEIYQERLRVLNVADFGDLILLVLKLFQENPGVLAHYQEQFLYILVDEYQDTNVAQYLWLRLLAAGHSNICCVGDDDQSIYGCRVAEVENILRFEKDYPGAVVIRLEQNYRSTGHILGAASGLIKHNAGRLGKTLWTQDELGDPVHIQATWDNHEEARFVAENIEVLYKRGYPLGKVAILVRASFQTREFEERFLTVGIPYRVVGGLRFYDRMEIRDALAYLRIVLQPNDSLAFERILNTPKRGIGATTVNALHQIARDQGISMAHAGYLYSKQDEGGSAGKRKIAQFLTDLDRWRGLVTQLPHGEAVKMILDESGYTAMWMADKSPDAATRLENLKELVTAIEEFGSLPSFLEHVSLVMENNQANNLDQVSLMTLHAAKGLEFGVVFLPGWEEGIFPHPRCLQDYGAEGLEEERRLGYVGISRARERAIITYAQRRSGYQGWNAQAPSRFIKELPKANVEHYQSNGRRIG